MPSKCKNSQSVSQSYVWPPRSILLLAIWSSVVANCIASQQCQWQEGDLFGVLQHARLCAMPLRTYSDCTHTCWSVYFLDVNHGRLFEDGFGVMFVQSSGNFDLKEPYYRQLTSWYVQQGQQQQVLQTQQQAPLAAGFMQPGVGVVSEGVQSPQWQQHQQYQQQQHQPYQQQQQQYQQQQHRTYSSRVNGHIG